MKWINLHPFYYFCGQIGGRASRSTTLSKSAIHTLAAITCAAKNYEFRIVCVVLSSGTLNLLLFVKPVCGYLGLLLSAKNLESAIEQCYQIPYMKINPKSIIRNYPIFFLMTDLGLCLSRTWYRFHTHSYRSSAVILLKFLIWQQRYNDKRTCTRLHRGDAYQNYSINFKSKKQRTLVND